MDLPAKSQMFLNVLQTNKGIIYKVANSYCNNVEDRKDLVQEIIIQLWRSFHKYSDQYKYTTWIYRIALNVAISFYRKEKRRKNVSNNLPGDIINFVETGTSADKEIDIGFLQQFIAELRELDKALMLLCLDQKSQKDIAGIMGISETNVATKISRIKKILKQKFSNLKAQKNE